MYTLPGALCVPTVGGGDSGNPQNSSHTHTRTNIQNQMEKRTLSLLSITARRSATVDKQYAIKVLVFVVWLCAPCTTCVMARAFGACSVYCTYISTSTLNMRQRHQRCQHGQQQQQQRDVDSRVAFEAKHTTRSMKGLHAYIFLAAVGTRRGTPQDIVTDHL